MGRQRPRWTGAEREQAVWVLGIDPRSGAEARQEGARRGEEEEWRKVPRAVEGLNH